MSGPVEEKVLTTGINGTNNSVQFTGGVYTIGQQINQYNLLSTSLQENPWNHLQEEVENWMIYISWYNVI